MKTQKKLHICTVSLDLAALIQSDWKDVAGAKTCTSLADLFTYFICLFI